MLSYNDITTNILYSGKAYSTSNGSNFDICSDTLTTVLEDILDYLDAYEGDCKVKTNSSDGTCGFLADKIISSDNSVTITSVYDNTPLTPTDYILDLTVPAKIDIVNSETTLTSNIIITSSGNIYNEAVPNSQDVGRLENGGDTLKIECTIVNYNTTSGNTVTLSFGGNILFFPFVFGTNNSTIGVEVLLYITRVSNTSVRVIGSFSTLVTSFLGIYQSTQTSYFPAVFLTVNDLDSTTLTNNFIASGTIVANTLTGRKLLMTILKK